MEEIKKVLAGYAEIVDKTLQELMDLEESALAPTLVEAMKYTLFSGGKRIRPILTILTAEMVGGDVESARRVGSAIELIHTYSLIHDDLPSMDDDDYRRGKLTNHKVYGPGVAILAGDGLLTLAFNIISKLELPAESRLNIIELISEGAGYNGMVGGQVLDLEAEERQLELDELVQVHQAKTGALFKASILAGAFCGKPNEQEIKALIAYAEYLGLTFQIVDDILDVIGDEKKLGKKVGRDQELNKTTYPALLGLANAKMEAEKAAALAQESLQIFGEKGLILRKLISFILNRQS